MKTRTVYLILLVTLLASACTPGATGANQAVEPPVAQAVEVTPAAPQDEPPAAVAPTEAPSVETTAPIDVAYPIVDTGQSACYDARSAITCPTEGEAFYGQDAQFTGNAPSYTNNGDPSASPGQAGTVSDNVTGLIWQQSADTDGDGDIDAADKMTYQAAGTYCENLAYAGYDDWQLPSIKQLYSLIDFDGIDPSGYNGSDTSGLVPFIDTDYFDFAFGDTDAGERIIDAQYASSTLYVATTMNGSETMFGVNLADGRIKGYGLTMRGGGREKTFFILCARGNTNYGFNDLLDNGDPSASPGQAGTITDNATGLMWAQNDSGTGLNWAEALAWVETQNAANYLGYSDWRLPNAKELQSIVDYTRSPDTTGSAAIDPLFNVTSFGNEAGQTDYAFYWSSTTHANGTNDSGRSAAYVSFGRAMGYMSGSWQDVHGAGAQRSDPKTGDPADYPTGHGPQGDAIRIYNYVRLVRGGVSGEIVTGGTVEPSAVSSEQPPTGSDQPPTGGEQPSGPGGQQRPDLTAAAAQLGITEQALKDALGDPSQGPPDFATAAQRLGITEDELIAALGVPLPPGGSNAPGKDNG